MSMNAATETRTTLTTAARKIAAMTGGDLYLDDAVRLPGHVVVSVTERGVTLRHGATIATTTYEDLPAGLTFRQIAAHALAVSQAVTGNGPAVKQVSGSVVTGPWSGQQAYAA
jgi:3,4-dihydroxy-2-butanone 4-phosphate synthase